MKCEKLIKKIWFIINKDIKIIVNIDQNKREIMRENITGGL